MWQQFEAAQLILLVIHFILACTFKKTLVGKEMQVRCRLCVKNFVIMVTLHRLRVYEHNNFPLELKFRRQSVQNPIDAQRAKQIGKATFLYL